MKILRVTDAENFSLNTYGADYALKEFFGGRADDSKVKMEMLKDIALQGYTRLANYTNDTGNKQTLNAVDVYFLGAGIVTDLVTPGLLLHRTINAKKKELTREKATYNNESMIDDFDPSFYTLNEDEIIENIHNDLIKDLEENPDSLKNVDKFFTSPSFRHFGYMNGEAVCMIEGRFIDTKLYINFGFKSGFYCDDMVVLLYDKLYHELNEVIYQDVISLIVNLQNSECKCFLDDRWEFYKTPSDYAISSRYKFIN